MKKNKNYPFSTKEKDQDAHEVKIYVACGNVQHHFWITGHQGIESGA